MKPLQVLVLMIAATAGLGATFLIRSGEAPPAAEPTVITRTAPADMTEILVAASDVPMWQIVGQRHLRWQPWPTDNIPAGAITRDAKPQAEREISGLMTRTAFSGGEPLRMERLMESTGDSGFMSAMLPPGKRAMAIGIDTRGTSSAGGFIHPNDRVDIVRIFREEDKDADAPSNVFRSETLFTNIRVLAIGQAVKNEMGSISFQGDTATVEVTPVQAEQLSLAQRTGHLTLVLRSFADTQDDVVASEPVPRAVTVTAGGSGGFNSSRFIVAQRPAQLDSVSEVASITRSEPARPAEQASRFAPPPVVDPIFRRSEIAAAGWLERMPAR